MGGNIPGGNFLGGNFPGGGSSPVGSLMGGNFPGGSFPKTILPWSPSITFQNKIVLFASMKAFQNMKNAFYFILKVFSFSRYLNFCPEFLVMSKKRLDRKDKDNFKICDVATWLKNSYNAHIAQYLTK